MSLTTWAMLCINHLKELTFPEWDKVSADKTPTTKQVATRVFSKLKGEGGLYPKKWAKKLGIAQASVIEKSKKKV